MSYRPTKATINLAAIKQNLKNFREHGNGADVIAVVKANGYGHGMRQVADAALEAGAVMLAVGTPDEAVELRREGVQADVLVLGATTAEFIPYAQQENIIVTAISFDWIDKAQAAFDAALPPLRVHLKVDTGMRRIGVHESEAVRAVRLLEQAELTFAGIYTHFATADELESELFNEQVRRIKEVIGEFASSELFVHVSNSAAALLHPELACDGVRVGIAMYGIPPSQEVQSVLPFPLYPALSLETAITHVKRVAAGESISYGATYTAEQDEWIAALPIGYADGMLRGLQGQEVLVQGRRVPVIGRICMDQCLIRLPYEMKVGESVQLIGVQGEERIFIDEWAERLGTIPYEVPCILTQRVPRVYGESAITENYSFQHRDTMIR